MEHALEPPGLAAQQPPSSTLDAWLRRQARRERRLVTLVDALFGNRERAYALYRLRFFFLRFLCSAALHIVRLGFLRFVFSHEAFLTTLVLNALVSLAGSFWWGALEVLRSRVRRLARDGAGRRIPSEIGQWLAMAVCLAVASLLVPAGWVTWELVTSKRGFNVLHLYVVAIGFRLGLDLVTLTFHSGVYAIRRIYRPLPAMVASELAGFILVVALWPWMGRWGFPVAVLASTILGTSFIVHYTARLYRLLGWLPLRLAMPPFADLVRWRAASEFLAGGTSYALMKLDAFLMLLVFRSHSDLPHGVSLFMLFVSVAPAVQAGFDWAQLLYFDLKKLDARCLAGLRRRYERFALRLAWLVGIVSWAVACLLGTVIMGRNLGELYFLIGPFFLCRSFFALAQIQAFSKRRYGLLFGSGAVLLATVLVLDVAFPAERDKLLVLTMASLLIAWFLRVVPHTAKDEDPDKPLLPLAEWLERLSQIREPVCVRSLRFASDPEPMLRLNCRPREQLANDRWRHRRMARRLARRLRGHGAVTVIHPGEVAWYEVGGASAAISGELLLGWGGGLVDALASSPIEKSGLAAWQAARDAGIGRGLLGRKQHPADTTMPIRQVEQAFRKMVPEGVIYCPGDQGALGLESASRKDRQSIFSEAVYFARHLQESTRRSRFDVTSLNAAGELKLVFIIDRRSDGRQRLRWRRFITRVNVAAALTPHDTDGVARKSSLQHVLSRWRPAATGIEGRYSSLPHERGEVREARP